MASQNYTTPGTYNFTVPLYTTLSVSVYGAGGGGGGGSTQCYTDSSFTTAVLSPGSNGSGGGNSSFGGVVGGGGSPGGGDPGGGAGTPGSSGGASGGNTGNTTGGGSAGGGGGSGNPSGNGGNGGNGGLATSTWGQGALTPGSVISVSVGGGGGGGAAGPDLGYGVGGGTAYGNPGGPGSNGGVFISWTPITVVALTATNLAPSSPVFGTAVLNHIQNTFTATPLAPVPLAASPIEAGVTLLLHCDGANGSTSFPDSSGLNTVTNNNCTVSTAQAQFGGSLNPNGGAANAFLSVTPASNFEFGAGNFTIDLWLWVGATTTSSYWVLSRAPSPTYCPFLIYLDGNGKLNFYASSNGTSWDIASITNGPVLPLGTWNHIAVVRNGNTITLYLNGVSVGTPATSTAALVASSNPLVIGATGNGAGNAGVPNYIDEVRVSRIARWTANFTPPIAPAGTPAALGTPIINGTVLDAPTVLLLHFDYPLPLPVTDSSGKNHPVAIHGAFQCCATAGRVGGASGQFQNAPNTYLSLDGSADFAFGTGDFTIEFWTNIAILPAESAAVVLYDGRVPVLNVCPLIYVNTTSGVTSLVYWTNGNAIQGGSLTAGVWYHIAVARSGGNTRLFLNGTQIGSTLADSGNYLANPSTPFIGMQYNGAWQLVGYVDELRISKGIARYTANFTAPTAPFTTDAYTVLLLHFEGPAVFTDSSPSHHALTYAGDAQLASATGKFQCSYYNDSISHLALDGSSDFAFGTGDFTIECWFATWNGGLSQIIYDGRASGINTVPLIYLSTNYGSLNLVYWWNSTNAIIGSTPIAPYTWYHVAAVRSAGVTKLYLNGVQEGPSYADTNNYTAAPGAPYIGDYYATGVAFYGFLDELRVSRLARWTAPFTPPTGPYGGYALTANSLAPASPKLDLAQPIPAIDPNCVLLLHFNGAMSSTSFPDTSGHHHTVTPNGGSFITTNQYVFDGASGSFNGTTNTYLNLDGGGDFAFGTGAFTIDFWFMANVFPASGTGYATLYDGRGSGLTTVTPFIYIDTTTGTPYLGWGRGGGLTSHGATPLALNTWYHVAMVRDGVGNISCYLNGVVELGPTTDSANFAIDPSRPTIGCNGNSPGNFLFTGWIDELEVLRGTARWPATGASFGPPTLPYRHFFNTPTTLAPASPALDTPMAGGSIIAVDLATSSPTFGAPALRAFFAFIALDLVTASPFLGFGAFIGQLFALGLAPLSPDCGIPLLGQIHHLFADTLAPLLPTSSTPEFGQPTRLPQPPPVYPADMDRHVRRSGSDYATALIDLLPRGQAWPRDPETSLIRGVSGLADYYGFVDGRGADLLERESDPRATLELLPDWERNWGLPDPCFVATKTIGERQAVLVMKMTLLGGQSRQFFFGVAAWLGYQIRITEYAPFMAGVSQAGDTTALYDGVHPRWQIGPPEMRYYWTVQVGQASLVWFRASKGQAGVDPHLKIGLADDLECLFERWKPAHTRIVFDYSSLQAGGPMSGTP